MNRVSGNGSLDAKDGSRVASSGFWSYLVRFDALLFDLISFIGIVE